MPEILSYFNMLKPFESSFLDSSNLMSHRTALPNRVAIFSPAPSRRRRRNFFPAVQFLLLLFLIGISAFPAAARPSRRAEAEREYRFAFQLLENNMPRSAIPHFRRYLEKFPDHKGRERALLGLAQALEQTGEPGIEDVYRRYLDEFPKGKDRALALLGLGRSQYKKGKWSEARTTYHQFAKEFPNHPEAENARLFEAVCLTKTERYDEATALLQELRKSSDRNLAAEADYLAARIFYTTGEFGRAVEALISIQNRFEGTPAGFKAHGLLGDIYYQQKRYASARREYSAALKGKLSYADDLLYWKAWSAIKAGDTTTGTEELISLATRFPKSEKAPAALLQAAGFKSLFGDSTAALSLLEDAAKRGNASQRAEALYKKAMILIAAGRIRKARPALLRLLEFPNAYHLPASYYLGLDALDRNDLSEAHLRLETARDSALPTSEWRERIILGLLDLARRENNAADYDRYLGILEKENSPVLAHVILNGAKMREAQGDLEGAAHEYQRILREFPASSAAPEAAYSLGVVQYSLGDYNAAEKAFQTFTRLAKKKNVMRDFIDDARYWIGFSRYQRKDLEGAAEAFSRVASDTRSNRRLDAAFRAGDAFFGLERYERAVQLYTSVIEDSSAPKRLRLDSLFNRAAAFQALGRSREAREDFLSAWQEGDTEYEEALLKIGDAYREAGQDPEAARAYEFAANNATTLSVREEALFQAAETHRRLGDTDSSIRLFLAAAGIAGGYAPNALFSAGRLLLAQGDTTKARTVFREASDSYPRSLFGRWSRYRLALLSPSPDSRIQIFHSLLDEASSDIVAGAVLVQLGRESLSQDQIDSAQAFLEQALEFLPDGSHLATAKILLGNIFLQKQQPLEAQIQYEYIFRSPAFAQNPLRFTAGIGLLDSLIQQKRTEEAITLLEELTDKFPERKKELERFRRKLKDAGNSNVS
ncbi:MAG: hypothetical protein D6679_11775 [Candidatus Hydrogenedentota bacterium]|nr:MAG: hypothetical protein D6679_11775 [Candidatus Hydrogenedentota bacterium]